MFTKNEQQFIDYLDAIIQAELDLETSIQTGEGGKRIHKDYFNVSELKKEFFKWVRPFLV
jgi:hypothetical protein